MIELAVAVAIAGVLAAATIAYWRSAVKNAASGDAAFDIAARLESMRTAAMRDGTRYVAVIADVVGNDTSNCNFGNRHACASTCVLRDVQPGFDIAAFQPGVPSAGAVLDECIFYGNGVRFQLTAPPTPPAPFNALTVNDPGVVTTIAGRRTLGIRFDPNGRVQPELPVGMTSAATAVALSIGSDAVNAAAQREVVVTFPFGMVRTFGF